MQKERKNSVYYTIGILVFIVFILYFVSGVSLWFSRNEEGAGIQVTDIPAVSITPETVEAIPNPGIPVKLTIPAINVDVKIQEVGVTAKGTMGIPTNFTDVGWYRNGARPGASGNAFIDGHLDNGLGLPAVFYDLNKLKTGDEVYVTDSEGRKILFKVIELRIYDYNSDKAGEIFIPGRNPNLYLITCGGQWIRSEKTYDKRIVVIAQLVGLDQ